MNSDDAVVILDFAKAYLSTDAIVLAVSYASAFSKNDALVDVLVGEVVRRIDIDGANELLAKHNLAIKFGVQSR